MHVTHYKRKRNYALDALFFLRQNSAMSLSEWLASTNTSQAAFAAMIDVTQSSVSRYLAGMQPSWSVARRIQKVTGNAVQLHDWPNISDERNAK